MNNWIRMGTRQIGLLETRGRPVAARPLRFHNSHDALRFLRDLANEPLGMARLREWLMLAQDGGYPLVRKQRHLLEHAAALLAEDRLVLGERIAGAGSDGAEASDGAANAGPQNEPEEEATTRVPSSDYVTPSTLMGKPAAKDEPEQTPPSRPVPPVTPDSKTHWIEIELLGEDDAPIPDEAYVIKLPDGSEKSGKLDGEGFARVDGIEQSGTCQISFPDLDKDAWEPVDSVGAKKSA